MATDAAAMHAQVSKSETALPTVKNQRTFPDQLSPRDYLHGYDDKSLNEEEDKILTFMMSVDVIRFILLTLNLILGMGGILFFAFGLMYTSAPHSLMNSAMKRITDQEASVLYEDLFRNMGSYFISLGLAIIFVFLFGFYATSLSGGGGVIQFAGLVTCVTICQVIVVTVFFNPSSHSGLHETMATFIFKDFNEDIVISKEAITIPKDIVWMATQLSFNCCGIEGPKDYEELSKENRTVSFYGEVKEFVVPISCCRTKKPVENAAAILDVDFENLEKCVQGNPEFYKTTGCKELILKKIQLIKNTLFVAECVISFMNVYCISCAIFDWWATRARNYIT